MACDYCPRCKKYVNLRENVIKDSRSYFCEECGMTIKVTCGSGVTESLISNDKKEKKHGKA